jgi:glycyl-tRNA synthetase
MKKHQRYFAVEDERGKLMPYFIAVRNGDAEHLDKVTAGNEHVIIARFRDAEFFFDADVQKPLADYLERLSTLTFQEELGSVLDKNNRVAGLVKPFGELLGAADDLIEVAQGAARLAKADLATQMVIEMTSLQGTMGRIYAERGGTDPDVANANFEHWLPRGAGDRLPSSPAGILLALLDRLDSLVGLFAVGLAPTGSADPYALRRAALGVVQILVDRHLSLDLREAVRLVAEAQPVAASDAVHQEVLEFIAGRFKGVLLDSGEQHDVVEAVLAEQAHDPAQAVIGVGQLTHWVGRENWSAVLDAFARCVRIIRSLHETYTLQPDLLTDPAEKSLYEAYQSIQKDLTPDYGIGDLLGAFEKQVPAVNAFFEGVMVMAEDKAVRENRLALLQALTGLANGRADLSHLSGF